MRKFAILLSCLIMMGCSTSYGPQGLNGGYASTMLAKDIFLVGFKGNDLTDSEKTHNFAMLRSAELAIEKGYPYFIVLDMNTESYSRQIPLSSARVTTVNYGSYSSSVYKPAQSGTFTNYTSKIKIQGFTEKTAPSNALRASDVIKEIRSKYKLDK